MHRYCWLWQSCIYFILLILPGITFAQVNLDTLQQVDSGQFSVTSAYGSFNRRSGVMAYNVTLTNTSSSPLFGPVYVEINSISSPDVSVSNADDSTNTQLPIFIFSMTDLAPGESTTKPVLFSNKTRARFSFNNQVYSTPKVIGELSVQINSPVNGLVTKDALLVIAGDVSGASSIQVNGAQGVISGNNFTVANFSLLEGTTTLVATAIAENGDTISDSSTVRLDTTAPLIVIESPQNGDRLVTDSVAVAGTVNDIIPGATVNADDVSVVVNGVLAEVSNRTFFIPALPLVQGTNTLEAIATDRAGNTKTSSIQISYEPNLTGVRISLESGNAQSSEINSLLPQPLMVKVADKDGGALSGRVVTFAVTRGDGLLNDPDNNLRSVTLLTNAEGLASVDFKLGSRTGRGLHRIKVTSPGSLSFAEFCASALNTPPANIAINRMPSHKGVVGKTLTDPLSVIVTDSGGNPVDKVPVTFSVDLGNGNFAGQTSQIVLTNPDGIAEIFWTLGADAGIDSNVALATFSGNLVFPATFTATGVVTGNINQTTVSGVVQNNSGNPIVDVRAVIAGSTLESFTGADGRFVIADVSPGGHHVTIQGSSVNDEINNIFYPDIEFAVEVLPGADNALNQIVVLPFLDMSGAKLVGGSQDVVLTMAGVPGFEVKIFANSVIKKDGTRGELMMSSSQVKFDKIPMPPPQGATPLVVGTLQPGGIKFDPPAQVTYPNVNGLSPGDVADIFAFHHDIGQFVNIGPGTVSEDGTVITSDPGFGIVQSGWHGVIRIPGPTSQAANGCSATATVDGKQISPSNPFVLAVGNSKTVTVTFNPAGTIEGGWSSADIAIATASGSSLTTNVTGVAQGKVTITSPTNRISIPADQGGDKTCVVEIEVEIVDIDLDAMKVNMNSANGELPDAVEEIEGAFIPINSDDDDYSVSTTSSGADKDQTGLVSGESDLMPIILHKTNSTLASGSYKLDIPSNTKVWKKNDRSDRVLSTTLFDASIDTTLYVEGVNKGSGVLKIDWTDGSKILSNLDRIKVTVFNWVGPLNVPGFSIHQYTASGALASSKWTTPSSGTIKTGANTSDVTILWGKGPIVGLAVYNASSNYKWNLEVNVVEVKVESPTDAFTTGTPSDAGTTLGAAGDLEKVVKSGNPGINWKAKITLSGPNNDRGVERMRIGFVQNVRQIMERGSYNTLKKTLKSNIEGKWFLDHVDGIPPPHYVNSGAGVFFNPSSTLLTKTITSNDTPVGGAPITFDQGNIVSSTDDVIDLLEIDWEFLLYVVASTIDSQNNANKIYTSKAKSEWRFNGSGAVGQTSPYTWVPGANAKITAPSVWSVVVDGTEPALTSGTQYNSALTGETFSE